MTDMDIESKLEKPGAGLPLPQRLYLRYYLGPFVAAKADWDKDARGFKVLGQKIQGEVKNLSDAQMTTRILVPPQKGLEDSSRYWSAAMALEHMAIVGEGQKNIILSLANGVVPNVVVDVAKVKPLGQLTPAASVAAFKAFIDTTQEDLDRKAADRFSAAKLVHPWFGPFTARQWHWTMTSHLTIHLAQIRAIRAGLK